MPFLMAVSLSFPHIKLTHDPPHGNRERERGETNMAVMWRGATQSGAPNENTFSMPCPSLGDFLGGLVTKEMCVKVRALKWEKVR